MNPVNAHLLCFSPTHSSHIIGECIIQGLEPEDYSETDLTYEAPPAPLVLKDCTVVLTVPVYGGRVSETAMKRLLHIRGDHALAIPVVLYGNRGYDDALLELRDWCIVHGFTPVAGAAFIGEHSYSRPCRPTAGGRPDESDLEKARSFGFLIQQFLDTHNLSKVRYPLRVKGHFPYKAKIRQRPQAPLTIAEFCSGCGFCAGICPTGSITMDGVAVSHPESCIKCCACVKQCPNFARSFDTPYTDLLYENFSERREPELFFLKESE